MNIKKMDRIAVSFFAAIIVTAVATLLWLLWWISPFLCFGFIALWFTAFLRESRETK